MVRPLKGDIFVITCQYKKMHWNNDTTGEVADCNPNFDGVELLSLIQAYEEWFQSLYGKLLVKRTLRVSLVPYKKGTPWASSMIAYYAKLLANGQRPVQEFAMVKNYSVEYQLRELLAIAQFPKVTKKKPKFDFDGNTLTDGFDQEVGEGKIWSKNLFRYSE